MLRRLILLLCMTLPQYAEAAVTITEVAWMGDAASANHEWIELYNSGDAAVSLDGWTLTDGMNLTVTLAGTITSGAYAVLERTSEESASGAALLLYTGALVNTGATLTLRNGGGAIQDQVPGGESWQSIGGDNTTKETAQYTDRGWITAPATPGRPNAVTGSVVSSDDTIDDETNTPTIATPRAVTQKRTSNAPALERSSKSGLVTRVIGPEQIYVNQPVDFSLEVIGPGPTITASLVHVWNFGDTHMASGTAVQHRYAYPGTYVITVRSAYAKHDSITRYEVTVVPVIVSVGQTVSGDITLNNDAPYEIDISGYIVSGAKELIIPPGTILVSRGTITIPRATIGMANARSQVALYDSARRLITPDTESAATLETDELSEADVPVVVPIYSEYVKDAVDAVVTPLLYQDVVTPSKAERTQVESADTSPPTAPYDTQSAPRRWPYAALVILIGGALMVILRSPKPTLDRDSLAS